MLHPEESLFKSASGAKLISKALVLLPRGPGTASGCDGVDAPVRIGGLSLLQRVLYNLQWTGVQGGRRTLPTPLWPEVERNVKEDHENRVFSWIPLKWPIVRIRIDYGKKHHF